MGLYILYAWFTKLKASFILTDEKQKRNKKITKKCLTESTFCSGDSEQDPGGGGPVTWIITCYLVLSSLACLQVERQAKRP